MTLKVEQKGATQTLSAHWQDPESGEALEEQVLAGAKDISFSYFVIIDGAGWQAWRSSWQTPQQLPSGVLMRFHYPELGGPIDIVVKTTGRMPEACILLPADKACRYGSR